MERCPFLFVMLTRCQMRLPCYNGRAMPNETHTDTEHTKNIKIPAYLWEHIKQRSEAQGRPTLAVLTEVLVAGVASLYP